MCWVSNKYITFLILQHLRGLIEVLSWYLPGRTEGYHGNLGTVASVSAETLTEYLSNTSPQCYRYIHLFILFFFLKNRTLKCVKLQLLSWCVCVCVYPRPISSKRAYYRQWNISASEDRDRQTDRQQEIDKSMCIPMNSTAFGISVYCMGD
jgi:hypothetical protein